MINVNLLTIVKFYYCQEVYIGQCKPPDNRKINFTIVRRFTLINVNLLGRYTLENLWAGGALWFILYSITMCFGIVFERFFHHYRSTFVFLRHDYFSCGQKYLPMLRLIYNILHELCIAWFDSRYLQMANQLHNPNQLVVYKRWRIINQRLQDSEKKITCN